MSAFRQGALCGSAALAFVTLLAPPARTQAPAADLVLVNGKIITVDAQRLGSPRPSPITDGRIVGRRHDERHQGARRDAPRR